MKRLTVRMRLILLIFGLIWSQLIFSQNFFNISVEGDEYQQFCKKERTTFKDSLSAINYLRAIQSKAIEKGHLMASFDSIRFQNKSIKAIFYAGPQFKEMELNLSDEDLKFIRKAGIREKEIAKIPFEPKAIASMMKELLDNALNSGYPFANVKIENLSYDNNKIRGNLALNKGKFFTWSDIHIKGDSVLNKNTIAALVGIHIGDKYEEDDLRYISENIRQVNYLKIIKPYELLFTENGVELFLYLESIPISSANGIIGLQPSTGTKKMTVTGELNLKLVNLLHRGESMQVSWRSVRSGTQNLQLGVNYPFLFKSPFGLDGSFQLYKRDTSFLETKSNAGVQYFLGRGSYLKAFYSLYTSDLISVQQSDEQQSLRSSSYGLGLLKRRIDYLPNPSKGFIINIEAQIGQRKLIVPDSVSMDKKITSSARLSFDWFIGLTARNVIRLNTSFSTYFAPSIFKNELLRFGGLNSLRGFNEEEFSASTFLSATFEYRFLTDRNSHAFVFYNQGFYENRSGGYYKDTPFGFGLGYAFGTPIGIFSISTALGKQFDNPILLRNSKIHFGYIAYF